MFEVEISLDELKIDASQLEPKTWTTFFKRVMSSVLGDHARKYAAGKGPDGSAQKQYSPKYRELINRPGGYRPVRGRPAKVSTKPNLTITGDLVGSRDVIEKTNGSVEGVFKGGSHYSGMSNGSLASALEAKGFKLHYFGKDNIKQIEDEAAKELDLRLEKVFTVKKQK